MRSMDPALRELLIELPPVLIAALSSEGIETTADVVGLYPHVDAFLEVLREVTGRTVQAEDNMQIARVYSRLVADAREARRVAVQTVVASRESVYPSNPVSQPAAVPASSARTRSLVGLGMGPAVVTTTSAAVPLDAQVTEAAKQVKLDALFNLLLEYILNLSELGVDEASLNDPLQRQQVRDTLLHGAARLSTARLGHLVSSFRRWLRFCQEAAWDPRSPKPFQLASFLHSVSRGGPTAAASMHAALKWFATHTGANFDLAHPLVAPFRFHASAHTSRQAPELEPWEMVNLMFLFFKAQGTHKLLIGWLLQSAAGCIRWEHIQRSAFVAKHGQWMEFRCSQGKSRRQGARPAYTWALPELCWRGQSLLALLSDYFTHEALPTAAFLVPGLDLQAEDLWEISPDTALKIDRPMSRGRFLEVFRGALTQCGLAVQAAKGATYNRLRRFLPTLANVVELDDTDAQAVGNWTDVVQGGWRSAPRPVATLPMSRHYAGGKTVRSAAVKLKLIQRFMQLWGEHCKSAALTSDGLLPAHSWSWEEFASVHARVAWTNPDPDLSGQEAISDGSGAIEVAPGALPGDSGPAPVEPPLPEKAPVSPAAAQSGSSSDSSSSASDCSVDAVDLEGILPDETAAETIPWFIQSARTHVVSEVGDDGRLTPYCRDQPFAQDPARRGEGFLKGGLNVVCQRCLGRMPRGLYLALSEHCGWDH